MLRNAGKDVVVCDGTTDDNRKLAEQIEGTVAGAGNLSLHRPRILVAGPDALPHYQPKRRPPDGHTFFETQTRKAVL